jgi:hypothetical protein
MGFLDGNSEVLESPVNETYARRLSTRDVEHAFRDATGEMLIFRSAVSEITDRLWEDYVQTVRAAQALQFAGVTGCKSMLLTYLILLPRRRTYLAWRHHRVGQLTTQRDRHLQGVLDQVGGHVVLDGPADHPTGVGIDHRGEVQPPLPCPQIGDVADPDGIEGPGIPGPLRRIGRVGVGVVEDRGGAPPLRADPA